MYVIPIEQKDYVGGIYYVCSNCYKEILPGFNYYPWCGYPITWDSESLSSGG